MMTGSGGGQLRISGQSQNQPFHRGSFALESVGAIYLVKNRPGFPRPTGQIGIATRRGGDPDFHAGRYTGFGQNPAP